MRDQISDGRRVVLKVARPGGLGGGGMLDREYEILKSLDPNGTARAISRDIFHNLPALVLEDAGFGPSAICFGRRGS